MTAFFTVKYHVQRTLKYSKETLIPSQCGKNWKMSFHPSKCNVISFHTKKYQPIINNYSIHGTTLQRTDCATYLGIKLDSNLTWRKHIDNTCKKANSTLFFLKRHLKSCPQKVKEQCYNSYVRSKLEYASSIWDPHLQGDIDLLEKVQRRAARFTTNNYNLNCDLLLKNLQWSPLTERRAKSKVTMIFKAKIGLLHIPTKDLIYNSNNTRAGSSGDFFIPRSGSSEHLYSFYPSSCRLWNSLPASTRDAGSLDTFKRNIKINTLR